MIWDDIRFDVRRMVKLGRKIDDMAHEVMFHQHDPSEEQKRVYEKNQKDFHDLCLKRSRQLEVSSVTLSKYNSKPYFRNDLSSSSTFLSLAQPSWMLLV